MQGGIKMSLYHTAIPMPKNKITFKKGNNGTIYVYYTTRAYRNSKGQPTSDEVAIGKKEPRTGMLIPNTRYFELFPQEATNINKIPKPSKVESCGNSFALLSIAENTGLKDVLKECFPDRWSQILTLAFYMLCEGNAMMYLSDWFDDTEIQFAEPIDDKRCSELFASIAHEERMCFFSEWIKLRTEREYIVYDVTSISTYAQELDAAEMGYNRDGEKLPQVNIGMYYGVASRLPVFFNLYNGSITDKSHLVFMLNNTERLGIKNVCFVLDRGFVTNDNLNYMKDKGYRFITAFPQNRLEACKLIDIYGAGINKSAYRIHEYELYGSTVDYEYQGIKMKAHIYYDPDKRAFEERELYSHVDKLKSELEQMSKTKRITKKYTDYFKVNPEKKNNIYYEIDTDKIDEKIKRLGFFILLSTELDRSAEEVLKIYKGRDMIEKNFEQLKNDLDFRRLKTHITQTTDGKIFVGFLALILRTYLFNSIKKDSTLKNLSMRKILWELRKIRTISFIDTSRIVMPMTKLQKTIFSALGLTEEQLKKTFT
jgi:transposase